MSSILHCHLFSIKEGALEGLEDIFHGHDCGS